ncbi:MULTISPECIES: type VI secretion system Vgr family protein [Acidiphilium]|jgi:type VI secretion system secreted protein VgrG|uniref:Rhs element Vgr protein n=2 Tax=Acidiphilium TaxID=522 RepID=A5G0B1_ACICJ|nr:MULTISPECIES: type VI secretion system tip protein TssI/VgrG [Acidiphilium]MBU6357636.1 type VI secretion system tip protein VgrG [Rhodospirillales bacterium]ABQ31293.1 Rhs element Vgr protein [Acidiphilium cryptum JF-5]EGO96669.1 Rhs element Vgr protein [Acidiphilium sp. PM]MBS3024867.1 type VI secretion system tip protein VgrG [Acidiphilium multivorum]BAJ81687.1 hypothetical protein ACMV_23400 [Acidiphilium multivorum AIU301]
MTTNIDLLDLQTSLGSGVLTLVGVNGQAALSQCFRYTLSVRAGAGGLDPNDLLYTSVTVAIGSDGTNQTYINGLVSSVVQKPGNAAGTAIAAGLELWDHELTVVPALWFLGQTLDCRIFQNKTAVAIVKEVLDEFEITSYELPSGGTSYDYTVMFNETYLDFINRILARDGLFYYFVHEKSGHKFVVASSSQSLPKLGAVKFAGQTATEVGVHTLSRADSTTIGKFIGNDYNYETASTGLVSDADTVLKAKGAATRKFYRYPSENPVKEAIGQQVRHQNEAAEVRAGLFAGGGNTPSMLAPGNAVTITGDPFGIGDYVIAAAALSVTDHAGIGGGTATVDVAFTLFDASVPWRPELLPKPQIAGLQSALVVGPSGDEIYTNKYGRVKVQFNWDTRGKKDENSSCWVRVIQPWAGAGWGFQFLPRIGQEVAISFLESDIDRPVVIGSFYNSGQVSLFNLPAEQNKAGFRSRSTKSGGTSNYSEFSIDDTKGSEVVLLHAERDYTVEVEHDETRTIGNNRTVTVKKDEAITVDGNQTETVKGNRTFEVKQDHSETVDGNQSVTVKGKQSVSVQGQQSVSVTGAVTYESMESITLKVGGNSIKIDMTGITLSGTLIKINAQAELSTSGAIAQHSGSGMLKLQGGIIMVN